MFDAYLNGFVLGISLFIQALALEANLVKSGKKYLFVINLITAGGLILGLSQTSILLFKNHYPISLFNNFIYLDGLSLYFLFIIQLISIPTIIYNLSYLQHYIENGKSIKSFSIFFNILLISTQLLVIANHAIVFLVFWEIMSLTSYFAMVFEYEKEEVQKGSFYYFAASHVIVFILYIVFFILHQQTGSWYFTNYHLNFNSNIFVPIIFILSFIGFGIKAGFIPFHFWLPQAHPIAPTVLSSFLSGVLIKMGIYGILRIYLFIKPVPEWTGWFVLVISIISAILGVWYALAQHDIKKLLAYHSVENIGIIGIGIGIGFIGSANNLITLEVLGFGGALLHTLNHATFKSLLFLGSGVLYQNLGTRNIEQMGGIANKAKYISIFFLIGSVAISGIPPFNGFISEFIIYSGFFNTAFELKSYYQLIMLLFVVALAFVGGLAVACFTKVNGIIFLGTPRSQIKKFTTNFFEHLSLGILAALCIAIGFYPQPIIIVINKIIMLTFNSNYVETSILLDINWSYFTSIFSLLAILIIVFYLIKLRIESKFGRKKADAWGCGYENLNSKMQYTASSYADELNLIPQVVLQYHKKYEISKNAYPKKSKFESHSKDFIDSKIVLPLFNKLKIFVNKIKFFSQTDIRYYIGFILIIISIYSLIAFLWQ